MHSIEAGDWRRPPTLDALSKADPAAALSCLHAAAHQGDAQAQLLLGQLLLSGAGVARDPDQALRWFRRAARVHVPMAMNMIGRCYEYGLGTRIDHAVAAYWYRRAAAFDCEWGLFNFAHLLATGGPVATDRAAAH